jgi:dihydroorotate dehydrogenase electron transfer subunit
VAPTALLLVLLGADTTFSFKPRPSTILVPCIPAGVIACVPQLDEFGIASRLASPLGLPGCHDGSVIELAELWLTSYLRERPVVKMEMLVNAAEDIARGVEELGRRLELPVRSI